MNRKIHNGCRRPMPPAQPLRRIVRRSRRGMIPGRVAAWSWVAFLALLLIGVLGGHWWDNRPEVKQQQAMAEVRP